MGVTWWHGGGDRQGWSTRLQPSSSSSEADGGARRQVYPIERVRCYEKLYLKVTPLTQPEGGRAGGLLPSSCSRGRPASVLLMIASSPTDAS